ncbi:MAG: hypothetical protein NZL95_01185 [Chitinophagales bacterium]|nr:hypothetical protein [Chitinophagales bacterium]MDW8427150.1 hypothetical protein [Chitinophagales bacterium]
MHVGRWRSGWLRYGLVACAWLLSVGGHAVLAYCVRREQFYLLVGLWSILFVLYFVILRNALQLNLWVLTVGAVVLRLVYLKAVPALSDDYNRFLWDGHLWQLGINPYAHRPVDLMAQNRELPAPLPSLFAGLNSPLYYTVYPPLLQYVFRLSALTGPDIEQGIMVLRAVVVLAETGTLLCLPGLLRRLGLPASRTWWYGYNPLIITELTGNLHMEGLMIFAITIALCFLLLGRKPSAAVAWAAAVAVKLLPLMWLAFLPKRMRGYSILFGFAVVALVALSFLPFAEIVSAKNLGQSLDLYFRKFEFNAGIYGFVRWISTQLYGYHHIATTGPLLALLAAVLIGALAVTERHADMTRLPRMMLLSLTIYLLCSPVVHPWYLATLVALAPMAGVYFPLVWSAAVVVSYAAYRQQPYEEIGWLVALEYVLVGATMVADYVRSIKVSGKEPREPAAAAGEV